jgi:hypothetical protein
MGKAKQAFIGVCEEASKFFATLERFVAICLTDYRRAIIIYLIFLSDSKKRR